MFGKLRYAIKSAFREYNGRGQGLSLCVVTEKLRPEKANWFYTICAVSFPGDVPNVAAVAPRNKRLVEFRCSCIPTPQLNHGGDV